MLGPMLLLACMRRMKRIGQGTSRRIPTHELEESKEEDYLYGVLTYPHNLSFRLAILATPFQNFTL